MVLHCFVLAWLLQIHSLSFIKNSVYSPIMFIKVAKACANSYNMVWKVFTFDNNLLIFCFSLWSNPVNKKYLFIWLYFHIFFVNWEVEAGQKIIVYLHHGFAHALSRRCHMTSFGIYQGLKLFFYNVVYNVLLNMILPLTDAHLQLHQEWR